MGDRDLSVLTSLALIGAAGVDAAILLSAGMLLNLPAGSSVRPLLPMCVTIYGAPLGLFFAFLAWRDRGAGRLGRRAAVVGIALGLLPVPLGLLGTWFVIWLKGFYLPP